MKQKIVMIYGAGQCGKMVRTYLKKDYTFAAFIDRRDELQGKIIDGLPVIDPDQALARHPDLIIVAVMNREQNELITEQLIQKGADRERILSVLSVKQFLDARFSAARLIAEEIKGRNVPGAVAELGVYQGEFAALISELFPDRSLYLFDTFEGFDEKDVEREIKEKFSSARIGNFRDTSVDLVKSRLAYPEKAVFIKGYFPESAGELDESYAFVSIDADLYQPIYEGLKYFYPRMSRGGYILIHDYNNLQFKGAGTAVREYCSENNLFIVPLSDVHGTAVLVKHD